MKGMNDNTGKALTGIEHLRQSITRLLSTPVGTRVMRREYGSYVLELIDQPGNPGTLQRVYAATVDAITRWETRLMPTRIYAGGENLEQGQFDITIEGVLVGVVGDLKPGTEVEVTIPLGTA